MSLALLKHGSFYQRMKSLKSLYSYHFSIVLRSVSGYHICGRLFMKCNKTQWTKRVFERQKELFRGKNERTCAGSQRCQRLIDSLCSLSAIVCVRVCVCLSFATFFHLTCFNTFPLCVFFPPSPAVFAMSCFVSLFANLLILISFRLSSPTRLLFLLCLLTHYLKDDFQAGSCERWLCHSVTGAPHETV